MGNSLGRAVCASFAILVASCATAKTGASSTAASTRTTAAVPPGLPTFLGFETDRWLVLELEPNDRDDLLAAFQASARSYGCGTEEIGNEFNANIFGERRSHNGVGASCREGTIALITLVDRRVSVGCAKPTTRQACAALLRTVCQAR